MDTLAIKKALEGLKDLPAAVADWRVEIGEDATGDDAVWVWVELAGDHVGSEIRQLIRDQVRKATEDAASSSPSPWVYVRVLERSEKPST